MRLLLPCFIGCCLLCGCRKERVAGVPYDWERVKTGFPPPMVEGTPRAYPKLPVPFDIRPEFPPVALARTGYLNLAAGRPVTSSDPNPLIGSLSLITDGDKTGTEGTLVELYHEGPQWVQLDLGSEVGIQVVWIWHRSGMDTLVYNDVIVEVSNDPNFKDHVVQVFNNDYDNSAGRGRGTDRPYTESRYGKPIQVNGVTGCYVRCYSNGNSWNTSSHYAEIEVFGHAATTGGGQHLTSSVDPMHPAFMSFEKDFWEEATKQRLIQQNADGLVLRGSDELIIRISQNWNKRAQASLDQLMQLANARWNQHQLTPPLRKIEVRGSGDGLLSHLEPGGAKMK